MRERKYLCKFDKWLTEKGVEESWGSVALAIVSLMIIYPLMHYLPDILFYFQGYVTPPRRHMFTMMWVSTLCAIILFFTVLKIIRLIRRE